MLLSKIKKRSVDPAAHSPCEKSRPVHMRIAFAFKYPDVIGACSVLHGMIHITPKQLALRYMQSIMRTPGSTAWWQENAPYLTEPWFIYEYARENNLLRRTECSSKITLAWLPIEPEAAAHGSYVRLYVERQIGNPSCGSIAMEYEQADKAYHEVARAHRYQRLANKYVRIIAEVDGNICDRAVEMAIVLLRQGYRVCVNELALKRWILAEDYEEEYPYWIIEGSAVDRLELRYPRDKQLHGYVYRAGGRWNGKTVEISICNAHLLDDLIRLYGFHITTGAKMRMDAWQETLNDATVYRPRKRKGMQDEPPMIDRFKAMLDQKPQVIDDLRESDE